MAITDSTPACRAIDSSSLPTFIVERNARAVGCGLVIERQKLRDYRLTSCYRGSEKAFAKAGLIASKMRSFPGKARMVKIEGTVLDPDLASYQRFEPAGKHEGPLLIADELLPQYESDIGDGIVAYEMVLEAQPRRHSGSHLAYVGPFNALVERGIAHPDMDYRRSAVDGFATEHEVFWWKLDMIDQEMAVFRKYIYAHDLAQRHEADVTRRTYSDPAQMKEEYAKYARELIAIAVDRYTTVHTTDGHIFQISDEAREAIEDAMDDVRLAILAATVQVKRECGEQSSEAATRRFADARGDRGFQAMLASVVRQAKRSGES